MWSDIRKVVCLSFWLGIAVLLLAYGKYILYILPWIVVGVSQTDWSEVASIDQAKVTDRGAYYHVTARYLVDRQEPVDFDIIAGCDYRKPGSAAKAVRQTPLVYGKRTQNGHAVVISVPEFCDDARKRQLGQSSGVFDGSFIPFTIWFDDANNLEAGLGYMSIFAFNNPATRLQFRNATVRYATREEFEDWYENRQDNLVSTDLLEHNPVMKDGFLTAPGRRLPSQCHSVGFLNANEVASGILRKYWLRSRPDFWSNKQTGQEKWKELSDELRDTETASFNAYGLSAVSYNDTKRVDWSWFRSVTTYVGLDRNKIGRSTRFYHLPTEHYPVYYNDALNVVRNGSSSVNLIANVDYRPEVKGLAACYVRYPKRSYDDPSGISKSDERYFGGKRNFRKTTITINGSEKLREPGTGVSGLKIVKSDKSVGRFYRFMFRRNIPIH